MKSYKSRQLPYIETEKNIITKESPKKFLLNSEKIKEPTITPSRVPSCISTSQEYQIESNKLPKSKSSQKQNQSKNNYVIFKGRLDNKKELGHSKTPKESKNYVKKTISLDKIVKNNLNDNSNVKSEKKSFIEKNLNKKENVKNEMNEIVQNYIDNNLQNSKNCNFFRLFKMKRKNQNVYKEEIFPPLFANSPPLETEHNANDKNKNDKYINLLTKQNDDNVVHYRDALINSLNKKKLKENRIFIKIDEHFNKMKNDKSPKLVKKCFQGVIGNIKSNEFNNNISNAINLSTNNKNIKNSNIMNEGIIPRFNYRSITNEKNIDKNIKDNSNNKTPKSGEKMKYLNNKKNRVKIKLNTPLSNNIYLNKEEFNFVKNKEKPNLYRKNTPNVCKSNNNIGKTNNTIQTKSNNIKKNILNMDTDINKIKNKKIEVVEENVLGDSFRDELNIIISDVNNGQKTNTKNNKNQQENSIDSNDEINLNLHFNDDSMEKNIPKEQEERINLIKKFNRPDTSYGRQKKNN
jgi:hypothetical protein